MSPRVSPLAVGRREAWLGTLTPRFTILLLAQAGAPFTSGFVAKFSVIAAAVQARSFWLAVVAMVCAVIAAFAYLRVVAMYFGPAEIDRHVAEGRSFAFETTLSGRGYLRRIDLWRRNGYLVTLLFLALPSPQDAIERVRQRVSQGGHDIPEDVIRRRFRAGAANFRTLYAGRVDHWELYDNSDWEPVMVERSGEGGRK